MLFGKVSSRPSLRPPRSLAGTFDVFTPPVPQGTAPSLAACHLLNGFASRDLPNVSVRYLRAAQHHCDRCDPDQRLPGRGPDSPEEGAAEPHHGVALTRRQACFPLPFPYSRRLGLHTS